MSKTKNRRTRGKAKGTVVTKRLTDTQKLILETKVTHPDLTAREVAAIAETTHPHVIRTLRAYGIETTRDVDLYKEHRADVLAGLQSDAVKVYYTLSEEEKKKMIMRRGLVDLGISYDKERLERDLSTANVINVFADLEEIRKDHSPTVTPNGTEW